MFQQHWKPKNLNKSLSLKVYYYLNNIGAVSCVGMNPKAYQKMHKV